MLRIRLLKGLSYILQEGEGKFFRHGFIRHAQRQDALHINIVKHVVLELERFTCVRLHLHEQLHCYLLEITRVRRVVAEDDVALLGNKNV